MRLSWTTIVVIGISISIVALSYGFFYHYRPNMAEAKNQEEYRVALEREAAKKKAAETRVRDAAKTVNDAAASWRQIVLTRTPPTNAAAGGIDLSVNAWQLVPDAKRFRNIVQLAVNAQVKKGGIKLPNGGPSVPDPGNTQPEILANFFNYPAVPFPVVILDLGTITATGNYDQIVANYESWSTMPHFMALVDQLNIRGTSPHLTGTYNVQLLAFIRATDIFPPEPAGTLAASAPAAGGAPAAPRGGPGATPGIPSGAGPGANGLPFQTAGGRG